MGLAQPAARNTAALGQTVYGPEGRLQLGCTLKKKEPRGDLFDPVAPFIGASSKKSGRIYTSPLNKEMFLQTIGPSAHVRCCGVISIPGDGI